MRRGVRVGAALLLAQFLAGATAAPRCPRAAGAAVAGTEARAEGADGSAGMVAAAAPAAIRSATPVLARALSPAAHGGDAGSPAPVQNAPCGGTTSPAVPSATAMALASTTVNVALPDPALSSSGPLFPPDVRPPSRPLPV